MLLHCVPDRFWPKLSKTLGPACRLIHAAQVDIPLRCINKMLQTVFADEAGVRLCGQKRNGLAQGEVNHFK